jgi:hydrocephalus-inducing protein
MYVCVVQGTVKPLQLQFRGRVIGPTFYFEEKLIDFGTVSYGFLETQFFTIVNTSQVPLKYSLRVPEDGKFMHREFRMFPASGSILPMTKGSIRVEFIPENLKRYDKYAIVIDVEGVGTELLAIPIKGECVVPDVKVLTETIDFGM